MKQFKGEMYVVSDLNIKRRLVFKGIEVKKEIESRLHSTNSRTAKLSLALFNSFKTTALCQVPDEFMMVLALKLVRYFFFTFVLCIVFFHWNLTLTKLLCCFFATLHRQFFM